MFMIRSFAATATESVSANPVVVVIAIPEVKARPAGNGEFAADRAGITKENLRPVKEPAVGVPPVS